MAKLSDFLGSLVSSISDARVISDMETIKIAEKYAQDNLLQHFAVPRMRVDKVELNIPVAIDTMLEENQKSYEPIDNKRFAAKSYQQILKSLSVSSLPNEVSKILRTTIAEHATLLEARIRVGQSENALENFSTNIALKVISLEGLIFKGNKKLEKDELFKLQNNLIQGLQASLKDEIESAPESKSLASVQVIVEADKLREVKPENIITIKMTISEQGMEWIKMENSEGEVVSKLMPE